MKRVCISGYFGFDNIGDEAVLQTMIRSLRAEIEDIEIIVLSDNPAKTSEDYDVTAYDRWRWGDLRRAIKSSDLLISGGGSLFQDITGKKSLLYYLHIIKMAIRRKKPVIIYSQGIGPIESLWGRKRTVKVLRKAKKITVRDEDSADTLKAWGFRRGRVKVTADPVLNIGSLDREEVLLEIASLPQEDAARFKMIEADVKTEANTEASVPSQEAEETSACAASAVAGGDESNAAAAETEMPVTDLEATIVLDDIRRILAAKKTALAAEEQEQTVADASEAVAPEENNEAPAAEAPGADEETPPDEEAAATVEGESPVAEAAAEEETPAEPGPEEAADRAEVPEENPAPATEAEETEVPAEADEATEATEAASDATLETAEDVVLVTGDRISFADLKREGDKIVAFSLRQWDGLPVDDIASLGDYLIEQGYRLIFLPFQYPDDNRMEKEIIAKIQGPVLELDRNLSPAEMLYCLDQVDFMFGMRLHSLIMAAALKIPFASLSYDPKIDGFVRSLGLEVTGSLDQYDSVAFIENFKRDLEKADEIKATIEENLPALQEKAEEATVIVKQLLQRVR